MKQRTFCGLLVLVLLASLGSAALAQDGGASVDRSLGRELPDSVAAQKLADPLELAGPDLQGGILDAKGTHRFIVRLTTKPLAQAGAADEAALDAARQQISAQQADLLSRMPQLAPSARVLGQVQIVLNAVFVEGDAAEMAKLAADPAVLSVTPARDYELDLSETVPYIGASAVQGMGYDGTGVRVAVLDSGIDYYHAALGGSGNPADFAADDPTIIEPGTFPTAKVVGGYDFVGSNWPNTAEEPDPDPLDAGSGGGHGTHVAHIIGGVNGVAPGASLYAVKVCSSVSSSCSGIALIQGMEFAADPDGDLDPSDHVDLINMSLGSPYGNPFDDDLSLAVDNATAVGIMTVTSCGNSADKPYASGSPGNALTALATAQTNVPSAVQPLLEVVDPVGYDPIAAVFQDWSAPLTTRIEAPLQYADGAGGYVDGCSLGADPNSPDPANAPFPPGSLTGKIVLVDRGTCNFSIKIHNIQYGGGLAGIIGLVAPGDPFAGSYGAGGPYTIPGYMISQTDSNLLKGLIAGGGTTVAFDPAFGIPLVQHMVGSSSRGPNIYQNLLKPEIGAPGASVSAIAGTGTGEGPFGGTSGASPMVTGSAALLKQAYPGRSPLELKAVLMNTGETNIMNVPAFFGGDLAPISRIGGGEVRVDRALAAPAAAWDEELPSGGLGFGFVDVFKTKVLYKTVVVRNYSNVWIHYRINNSFRFANDEASGAVTIETPGSVLVGPQNRATFYVKMTIDGSLLPPNAMNSGSMGADPAPLTLNEYDGYLTLTDASGATAPIHVAWHVLPRQAAYVQGRQRLLLGSGVDNIELRNRGLGVAQNDSYTLLATSPDIPEGARGAQSPTPDLRAVGVSSFYAPAGYCGPEESFIWAFAINTWERQAHLMPVHHYIWLDTNMDGTDDYALVNRDASGLTSISDGRQLTYAYDLATGVGSAYFYTEHSTNTGNTVLYICSDQIGMNWTDAMNTPVGVEFEAFDFYYGGPGDVISGLVVTPYAERYYGVPADIPAGGAGTFTVYDFGAWPGDTPNLGVMLLTNGDRGAGVRGGASQDTEALLFTVP